MTCSTPAPPGAVGQGCYGVLGFVHGVFWACHQHHPVGERTRGVRGVGFVNQAHQHLVRLFRSSEGGEPGFWGLSSPSTGTHTIRWQPKMLRRSGGGALQLAVRGWGSWTDMRATEEVCARHWMSGFLEQCASHDQDAGSQSVSEGARPPGCQGLDWFNPTPNPPFQHRALCGEGSGAGMRGFEEGLRQELCCATGDDRAQSGQSLRGARHAARSSTRTSSGAWPPASSLPRNWGRGRTTKEVGRVSAGGGYTHTLSLCQTWSAP